MSSKVFSKNVKRQKVILDNDGGVDDLIALAILAASYDAVELIGVICIDADCFIDPAVQVCGKLLSGMQVHGAKKYGSKRGRDNNSNNPFEYLGKIPIGRSTLKAVHEFPKEWRADAIKMNDLPCMNTPTVLKQWESNGRHECYAGGTKKQTFRAGEEVLADLVMNQASPDDKVSICVTGPLSNIAYCIKKYGDRFTNNIENVVIMGGAVDVPGNVFINCCESDSKAEWNIYWDAPSAKTVFECKKINIVLFSLDATNSVPVTSEFVQLFGKSKESNLLSEFIGSSWAMCTHFMAVFGPSHSYYAWDALTAAWVVCPSIVQSLEEISIHVVLADENKKYEGQTKRVAKQAKSHCRVAKDVNSKQFYDMMIDISTRI